MGLLNRCEQQCELVERLRNREQFGIKELADRYNIPFRAMEYYIGHNHIGINENKRLWFLPEELEEIKAWSEQQRRYEELAKSRIKINIQELAEKYHCQIVVMHRYIQREKLGFVFRKNTYLSEEELLQIDNWRKDCENGYRARIPGKTKKAVIKKNKKTYPLFYKVSVFDEGNFIIKHCSLTESDAVRLVEQYADKGIYARYSPHLRCQRQ